MNKGLRKSFERNVGKVVSIFLLIMTFSSLSFATDPAYIYDEIGRIIREVSVSGEGKIFTYDEVGNLLAVSSQTVNALPPVLNTVSPDIFFAGTTTSVTISGKNLFLVDSVWSDAGGITVNYFTATDDFIRASVTFSPTANLGQNLLNIKTPYGTATIGLNVYMINVNPVTSYISNGSSVDIAVSISPSVSKAVEIKIMNNNPDLVNAVASVTVPSSGTTYVRALATSNGTAELNIEGGKAMIFVTPMLTGDMSIESKPVSVYWDTASSMTSAESKPICVQTDGIYGGATSSPVSVQLGVILGSDSKPVSVQTSGVLGDVASTPVSVEMPIEGAIEVSEPVTVKIGN